MNRNELLKWIDQVHNLISKYDASELTRKEFLTRLSNALDYLYNYS